MPSVQNDYSKSAWEIKEKEALNRVNRYTVVYLTATVVGVIGLGVGVLTAVIVGPQFASVPNLSGFKVAIGVSFGIGVSAIGLAGFFNEQSIAAEDDLSLAQRAIKEVPEQV
ncbi:MAG: hypothetical protein S4CHLAM45_04700 [Chlamydiales bacterium]|nr:hypothetical protein [Chlamydiales bacterium]MCH9619322.1 hypothetical protein [Chlamydiales bacterium]MCH9622584.1 hypothetical protein [Chlamydiales bacterium]